MCEIIIDEKLIKLEGSVLTYATLEPYHKMAKHVKVCDSVTEIGYYAFSRFRMMNKIEISNSVNRIGGYAFFKCEALEEITIPDSVTSIGDQAFYDCISLKSINIPKSVVRIGVNVFYKCNNVRVKTNVTKSVLSRMVKGQSGQIITICIDENEYPILSDKQGNTMVITGHVNHAGGMLYSGYQFNGDLNPRNVEPMYCYVIKNRCLTCYSLNEIKTELDRLNIY